MSRKILIRLVEKDKDALDRQDFLEVRLIENSFDRVFRFHLSDKCDSKILLDVVQHGVQYAIDSLEGACNAEMAVDAVSNVECIDRVKILHKIGKLSTAWEYGQAVKEIYAMVEAEPVVYVAPVVHAKWVICSDGYYPYCSNCSEEPKGGLSSFCPHCGAKMDLKD